MNILDKLGYIPLIIGDGGHGNNTPGKRTPKLVDGTQIQEYQFNKPTNKFFLEYAKKVGFDVLNVSPEEWDVSLKTRTDRANAAYKQQIKKYPNAPKDKLVIFVSFHYNALNGIWGPQSGVEVYHYPNVQDGLKLAGNILINLLIGTKQKNRGVKSANFHVLRETLMTAILIEAGFMDNKNEAKLMLNTNFQREVALETIKGCCDYIGVTYESISESSDSDSEVKNTINELQKQIEEYKVKIEKIKTLTNNISKVINT